MSPSTPSASPVPSVSAPIEMVCAWACSGRASSAATATRSPAAAPRREGPDAHTSRPPRFGSLARSIRSSGVNTRVNLFAWLHTERPSVPEKDSDRTGVVESGQLRSAHSTALRGPGCLPISGRGCFANTPFRTFADEGVDRGAPLRGEDLDLGPDVGQTWTVSGTVFSRLRVPVDSRRFRLAAPAGATVAAATAQHALYGIFTHRRPQHPDPRHAYGRPDDRPRKTPGRSRRGGPAYQPRVARPRTPLSVPSSIGLSRRCASTPRSRFRRSRSSTPRP